MPRSLNTAAVRDAAFAGVALAALTWPDPARLGPGRRHLLRLGSASVAGWAGWRAGRDVEVPPVPPAALGAAAGAAAALALAPVEEATDRWLQDRLRDAGVRRPRLVMALAAAGLGALAWATERHSGAEDELTPVEDLYHERPLDPALRELLRAMIEAGTPASAADALAQLDASRAQALGDDFESTVMLVVPEGTTRLVPHTQSWPVRARWHLDGHPVELFLQIHAGRLDHAALMPVEDDYPADVDPFEVTPVDDPANTWPAVDEVTLVEETSEGIRPVAVPGG